MHYCNKVIDRRLELLLPQLKVWEYFSISVDFPFSACVFNSFAEDVKNGITFSWFRSYR